MNLLFIGFLVGVAFSKSFFVLLGLGCVLSIGMIVFGIIVMFRRAKARVMFDLAKQLNGKAFGGGNFVLPEVVFQNQGQHFYVRIIESRKKSLVYLRGPWPVQHDRLSVSPESFWSGTKKLLGMQDLEIANSKFDSTFVLQANSLKWLVDLMTPQLQTDLLNILTTRGDVNLTIFGNECCLAIPVSKLHVGVLQKEVDSFLNLRFRMLNNLALSTEMARTFAQSRELKVSAVNEKEATCMVCGNKVSEEEVHCRRCNTPHHRDCWDYFEGCSRYGCGEKAALPAHRNRKN